MPPDMFARQIFLLRLVVLAMLCGGMNPLQATALETLLMPGKLISDHAKYETECGKCHERLGSKIQAPLCLECHKGVRHDLEHQQGFHGRKQGIKSLPCKSCHSDHKGRDYDSLGFDKATFDHQISDFALRGKHKEISCGQCHQAKRGKPLKYRDAPGQCIDCHKENDVHKGRLGKNCAKCHNENSWHKESSFDHDKTKFPLHGAHKKVTCASCHPNERYKNIATQCYGCHRINDVHQTRYGKKCQDCHGEQDWKKIRFDHDKDTEYPLKGRHQQLRCDTCHTGDIYADLETQCVACHKADDFHRGKFGRKCESCHSEKKWDAVKFDHDKDTKYLLRGRHAEVPCLACHRADIFAELQQDCLSCHRADDVHKGQQGKQCERCHNEKGWDRDTFFDHDLTAFPLLGMHALASCADCHVSKRYKNTKKTCHDCHEKDDKHEGRLGTGCGLCHNPNDWKVWRFDHGKQTDFPLDGAHEKLHCYACHRNRVEKDLDLPKTCYQCHEDDDVHMGRFGQRCERCHVTDSFEDIQFQRGRR